MFRLRQKKVEPVIWIPTKKKTTTLSLSHLKISLILSLTQIVIYNITKDFFFYPTYFFPPDITLKGKKKKKNVLRKHGNLTS